MKKFTLLLFYFTLLVISISCSSEHRDLGIGEAVNVDVGEGRKFMLMRTERGVSVVYFRNNLDELGLEISGDQIEIQRKEAVDGVTFLTITDNPNLIPKMRLHLSKDGNIKRKETVTGWKFQDIESGDQE